MSKTNKVAKTQQIAYLVEKFLFHAMFFVLQLIEKKTMARWTNIHLYNNNKNYHLTYNNNKMYETNREVHKTSTFIFNNNVNCMSRWTNIPSLSLQHQQELSIPISTWYQRLFELKQWLHKELNQPKTSSNIQSRDRPRSNELKSI